VGLDVEQPDAGDARERRAEGLDGGGVAARRKVWHTFDQGRWHPYPQCGMRSAERGIDVRAPRRDVAPSLRIPHSTLRTLMCFSGDPAAIDAVLGCRRQWSPAATH